MTKTEITDHILDLFSELLGISYRAMFGGYGVYKNGCIIAVIIDGELYFKVGDSNRDYYLNLQLHPFSYEKNGKIVSMSYYQAPEGIYEDHELLKDLVEQSYEVSLQSKKPRKKRQM